MSDPTWSSSSLQTRICTKCHEEKPLTDFFAQKTGKFGRRADCKDCCARPGSKKRFNPHAGSKSGHKICNTCLEEKPFEDFDLDKQQKDGYRGRCKQCYKDRWNALSEEEKEYKRRRDRDSRVPRIEQRREYDRERNKTENRRVQRRARAAAKREARLLEEKLHPPMPKSAKQVSMFKICPQCNPPIEKHLSEFPIDKNRPDGRSGWCKECANAKGRSESGKAREREYRRKKLLDPEYRNARNKKHNEWRRNNPLSQQVHTLKRIARKRAATTEPVSLKRVLERDGYWCYICRQPINPNAKKRSPESLAFDHVIPLQPRLGEPQGTHSEDNIRPAHKVCNARKSNKPLEILTEFEKQGP